MEPKFKPGDIVELKSGSPRMTVKNLHDKGYENYEVVCQWFGGKKLETGVFHPDSLNLAGSEDDSK